MILSCRACRKLLILQSKPQSMYICNSCNSAYPIINDIPILIDEPSIFLAKTFLFNENFIQKENNRIIEFQNSISYKHPRNQVFTKIKNALEHNLNYVKGLQRMLNPYFTKEDLLSVLQKKEDICFYNSTLEYLNRDWCWEEEGEKELTVIFNLLNSYIEKYLKSHSKNILMIGAGAGRTAWDLCRIADNVYAVDSSFSLASYFYKLLKGDSIKFNIISDRNIYSTKDIVLSRKAYLPFKQSDTQKENIEKLNFFVGDATNIFLPDESMDVITSIYFTDILPIHILLKEIKRVLKPGGIFIHFGPLGYHFSNPQYAFSAEEIKDIFIRNGFIIKEESRVALSHTYNKASMNMKLLNNWSFVAVKNNIFSQEILTFKSKIKIANSVNYEIKGVISENGVHQQRIFIYSPNGEIYEGSALSLDILKLCDTIRISDLIVKVSKTYIYDADVIKENILDLINELLNKGVLEIACN